MDLNCVIYTFCLEEKIAYQVLTDNDSLIKNSRIPPEVLAHKMLENKIITKREKRELVTDNEAGFSTDWQRDKLLDILRDTAKFDGSVFEWFIKVLEDHNTRISMKIAQNFREQYLKVISVYCTA